MNLPFLLALAVPLSCLAFLSLLALLGVMTLGAVIHVVALGLEVPWILQQRADEVIE